MDIKQLRTGIAEFCRRQIKKKQLPNWWRDPILVTASADERFNILPGIAAANHILPQDLLPTCRTVIVFFIPFTPELPQGNIQGKFASEDWGRSLSLTNDLIQDISEFIRDSLLEKGFASELTPATYNFDPESLTARWSHKHLAHIAGLGRFGMNAQMITPLGCAGRLGSLVTEADLGDHPLVLNENLCLHRAGGECLKCRDNCPVQAVTLKGIHRQTCNRRLQVNRRQLAAKGMGDNLEVCAKCVAGMPCSLTSPVPVFSSEKDITDGTDQKAGPLNGGPA